MAAAQFAGRQLARHTPAVTTATIDPATITDSVVLTAGGEGTALRARVQLLHPVIPRRLLPEACESQIG